MDLHQPFYLPDKFTQKEFGITRYDKMISYIDEWIGKFIQNIDFENTLLIFTSDHGDYIPLTDEINFTYKPNKFLKKTNLTKNNLERSVCDFVAGMTDRYAINLYKSLK